MCSEDSRKVGTILLVVCCLYYEIHAFVDFPRHLRCVIASFMEEYEEKTAQGKNCFFLSSACYG